MKLTFFDRLFISSEVLAILEKDYASADSKLIAESKTANEIGFQTESKTANASNFQTESKLSETKTKSRFQAESKSGDKTQVESRFQEKDGAVGKFLESSAESHSNAPSSSATSANPNNHAHINTSLVFTTPIKLNLPKKAHRPLPSPLAIAAVFVLCAAFGVFGIYGAKHLLNKQDAAANSNAVFNTEPHFIADLLDIGAIINEPTAHKESAPDSAAEQKIWQDFYTLDSRASRQESAQESSQADSNTKYPNDDFNDGSLDALLALKNAPVNSAKNPVNSTKNAPVTNIKNTAINSTKNTKKYSARKSKPVIKTAKTAIKSPQFSPKNNQIDDQIFDTPKTKSDQKPRLTIIIDDIYLPTHIAAIKDLGLNLTPSIFPNSEHAPTTEVAAMAARLNMPYMLHLPLEARNFYQKEYEPLKTSDSKETIASALNAMLSKFPGVRFINNHTGSKFTADRAAMERLLAVLDARGVGFIDSVTTSNYASREISRAQSRLIMFRDVFLDNELDEAYIKSQIRAAIRAAKTKGYAIAIGHPHKETFAALRQMRGELADAVELVAPGEMRSYLLAQGVGEYFTSTYLASGGH